MSIAGNATERAQRLRGLRVKAAQFCEQHGVAQRLEHALNGLCHETPRDVYGYLANYFINLSLPVEMSGLQANEVYDSRAGLTIQAHVLCIIRNEETRVCSAVTSSNSEIKGDLSIAVQWINQQLSPMLKGLLPSCQTTVDQLLSDFFLERFSEYEVQVEDEEEKQSQRTESTSKSDTSTSGGTKKSDKGKKNSIPEKLPEPLVLPGSVAFGSVSLAVAKTAAHIQNIPLYQHIRALLNIQNNNVQQDVIRMEMPIPMVPLLSCGMTSPGKLNLMEQVLIIPKATQSLKYTISVALQLQQQIKKTLTPNSKQKAVGQMVSGCGTMVIGCDKPEQPLDIIKDACNKLGLALGEDLYLAINCAAHDLMDYKKGKYTSVSGALKTPDELVDLYRTLTKNYPAITALIDPFRREDVQQWQNLSKSLQHKCALVCEKAFFPTNAQNIPPLPGARGFVYKQNHQTTITDLIELTLHLQGSLRAAAIIGTTTIGTCCDSLADVAVGLGVNFVKLGGLSGAERLTKYNRLICIEEELSQQGILGYKEVLGFEAAAEAEIQQEQTVTVTE